MPHPLAHGLPDLARLVQPRRRMPNLGRLPIGIGLLLIPSWISYLLIDDRDDFDTANPLYFHIPDLTQDPLMAVVALLVTPLVNTEGDQVLLVTGLLLAFGIPAELRLGTWSAVGIFWGASIVAGVSAGLLLHVLHPLFPDVETFDVGWRRVFNCGSAGGFALLGAFAVTSRWPWAWLGLFLAWELVFWSTISQDYTIAFHLIAVITGVAAAVAIRRMRRKGASD
jgi:hypothetical protein